MTYFITFNEFNNNFHIPLFALFILRVKSVKKLQIYKRRNIFDRYLSFYTVSS